MAREADIIDFRDADDDPHTAQMVEFLERFAAAAYAAGQAAEREACAKVCDLEAVASSLGLSRKAAWQAEAAGRCATAIRTRGQA